MLRAIEEIEAPPRPPECGKKPYTDPAGSSFSNFGGETDAIESAVSFVYSQYNKRLWSMWAVRDRGHKIDQVMLCIIIVSSE